MLNPEWDVESKNGVRHALGEHPHYPFSIHVELHTLGSVQWGGAENHVMAAFKTDI